MRERQMFSAAAHAILRARLRCCLWRDPLAQSFHNESCRCHVSFSARPLDGHPSVNETCRHHGHSLYKSRDVMFA